MKKNTAKFLMKFFILFGLLPVFLFTACSDDDDPILEDPIATFQYEISEDNWLEVIFTNFSSNATSYSWDFGDGNTSNEENPVHVYEEADNYDVTLTASNAAGVSASFTQTIEIKDPDEALALLAGQESKTWRLYRVESSMGVGPSMDIPRDWWALYNDGSRPCKYFHEFTFTRNMEYIFDDKGSFWGEGGVFPEDLEGTCFEATASNMINVDGVDVSAWLGGTHQFEYDPSTNRVTLIGEGAWIGLPKTATTGEVSIPQNSVTFNISIEERDGYDYMHVWFVYEGDQTVVWSFSYAHYHDPSLEPDVVEEQEPIEDIETITPTELGHTFESVDSFDYLGELGGASIITPGEDDPEDASATKVGKFERTDAQFQEAQLRVYPEPKNILFDNFTTVSIDVYLPSSNTYDPLTQKVIIGFGDVHGDGGNWWQNLIEYESDELELDEWVTVTFDLDSPSFSAVEEGQTVYDRDNLDMVFIQIGGGNHTSTGVFYVRNLIFE
ncbi:MAG: PKD domain-containing protein [Bacteroidetes bacterium]|nr:MAG: PKD domain-containing protein [Bacteroidota bacterium]